MLFSFLTWENWTEGTLEGDSFVRKDDELVDGKSS